MKKIVVVFAVLSLILMVGCSSSGGSGNDVDMNQVMENVIARISEDLKEAGYTDADFEAEVLPGYFVIDLKDEELDFNPYDGLIDLDKVEGGFTIQAAMMLNADRIIVFKVSDSDYLEELKGILEEEKQGQYDMWEQYLPDQFEKVKETIFEVEGDLIYYITYQDAEDIESIILDSLK